MAKANPTMREPLNASAIAGILHEYTIRHGSQGNFTNEQVEAAWQRSESAEIGEICNLLHETLTYSTPPSAIPDIEPTHRLTPKIPRLMQILAMTIAELYDDATVHTGIPDEVDYNGLHEILVIEGLSEAEAANICNVLETVIGATGKE